MEILGKLFGTPEKVKIMRLFLFNPNQAFDMEDTTEKTKSAVKDVRREIAGLEKVKLIKKRIFFKDVKKEIGKKSEIVKKKTSGWILNNTFPYLAELQGLLINAQLIRHGEILKRLSSVGKLKAVIVSGVFIQDLDSRVDILIVGDNLRKFALENAVKTIESEIGREINYTAFETPDFLYRLGVCDKLIRDILDYRHEKVLDRIGIR
ncbi:MAG: seg [Parcubacteria group bacterium]|nr:seg [Parcubacteria group bacterium]